MLVTRKVEIAGASLLFYVLFDKTIPDNQVTGRLFIFTTALAELTEQYR
jgi:hypothetical protein